MTKFSCNKLNVPLGGLITCEYAKLTHNFQYEILFDTETIIKGVICRTSNDLARVISKLYDPHLFGNTPLESTQINHWLTFSLGPLATKNGFSHALETLNKSLAPITYLVGKRLTVADFIVFETLYVSPQWKLLVSKKTAPVNVVRWYNFIKSQQAVINVLNYLPEEIKSSLSNARNSLSRPPVEKTETGRTREGKFVELPGAEMGKVVVRFPPEASGYLHIGHAKAALLNQYYQESFQGKLVMRFDDTNPAKENVHFEKVILEDVKMLDIKPDMFTHTSQYFDLMLEYCEKLLKECKAYVEDADAELMKMLREQMVASPNRINSVEKNLELWEEMKKGTEKGQKLCVRAKIDIKSPNGCLRDPTIYRYKSEPHPRTGTQYKVYPTYDFACPIVDSIEGVTHTLRTMEYHDRDPQYYWFIEALGLRKPYIWEYSRLSMTNTVLSKRKLTWFVEQGLVDGWDDPRMPTVRGVLRRGMTVQGLKEFIIAQGSSRSVVFMGWDKIWAFNKKVIDPIVPRYTALEYDFTVPILIKNDVKTTSVTVPLHPKNPNVGEKQVWLSSKILIDAADVEMLKEGENATFINWGNLIIKKINRTNDTVISIEAELNLDNKDYKKTPKLTWLADVPDVAFTPTYCVYFDHLISKAVLAKDEDFKLYVAHDTRREVRMLGDPELKKLKKNDIIQLQRLGFFRVDVAYEEANPHTGREQPIVLFSVPDGHVDDNPLRYRRQEKFESPAKSAVAATPKAAGLKIQENFLLEQITIVGNKVRDLKASKAAKNVIDEEVKKLLSFKAEYKLLTGKDWKPATQPSTSVSSTSVTGPNENELLEKIAIQGDKVRQLKTSKADKVKIDEEIKKLLELKETFKTVTGKEWKNGLKRNDSAVQNTSIVSSPPPKGNSSEDDLLAQIAEQGDKVRQLKADKADKAKVEEQVKKLLELKASFKTLTGTDWKPGMKPSAPVVENNASQRSCQENDLLELISAQGDIIRWLKLDKVDKTRVDEEVKKLLELKASFKTLTGTDWKPGMTASVPTAENTASYRKWRENDLLGLIAAQGDRIRRLKLEKVDKATVDQEVKTLLELKADFKTLTGKEWKPGMKPEPKPTLGVSAPIMNGSGDNMFENLADKITEQGNLVRDLKIKKDTKEKIDAAVKVLLDLKAQYKDLTGTDFPATTRTSSKPKAAGQPAAPKEKVSKQKPTAKEKKPVDADKEGGPKKQTRLGLEAKKEENLSDWYSQVITKGEMIEYYDVSGCYIFRPWSFSIWETIKDWFDTEIKKLGVQNCYFPIFVSRAALEKEKTHIADFAPEVAWVTKSGDSDMAEPIAVRPTSETVMYPAYAKWIQSYRDLPIKLNQWNNVVRWEFKHPQPFLRTREFLWQEGHTAFADKAEADEEVSTILDLYAKVYTDLLAIPVIKGRKTEKEKFAGGDYTLTVEAFVAASGRGIQGATSHHLGQNFSKMFDIIYEDPETQEKKYIYQNSWGITTRTIGVMIMVHADNQGLVLPPRVAAIQVVIVPCGVTVGLSEAEKIKLQTSCDALENELKNSNIRVKGDYRMNYSPGWKFNHWELKGVPVRVELGPKDIEKDQLVAVRRDTGEKFVIPMKNAVAKLQNLLDDVQNDLLKKAQLELNQHLITVTDWAQFSPNLDNKNILLSPFCGDSSCEDRIKADSARDDVENPEPGAPAMGAKSLCIPLDQPASIKNTDKCIHPDCSRKPKFYTLFGRSY